MSRGSTEMTTEVSGMTVSVDKLGEVERIACEQIRLVLADSLGQPIIDYCNRLVRSVLYGEPRPTGTPTDRVRTVVRTAINAGFEEVYSSVVSPWVSPDVLTRRNAL